MLPSGTGDTAVTPSARTDAEWLAALAGTGSDHDHAVSDLFALLRRAAGAEVARRRTRHALASGEAQEIADQAASDATVAVLAKLDTFAGRSRFTTWAYAFAVFEVSAAIGRHLRRARTVEAEVDWDGLPDRWGATAADLTHARELVVLLRRTVEQELTAHQRRVFTAVVVEGVPLDALVAELGTSRNAVYKTVFDARVKIRAAFERQGWWVDEAGTGRRRTA